MSKSQLRVINNEVEHPLDRARRLVAEWRSNAQRESLPISNQHDGKNAPVLDVDDVLRRGQLDHVRGRR